MQPRQFPKQQPPRETWRVEMVEQKTEAGLVLFEYALRETTKDPFLLNNHKAQIRTDHQRIIRGPNGGMMHVSGVEVLDPEEFAKGKEFYRWADKDRNGNWRDDRGRTLAPFVFAAAPWAGGRDEELDPQWQRETFTLPLLGQVNECIDRYQARALQKGYIGDRRGTTLNLQVGESAGDADEADNNGNFRGSGSQVYVSSHSASVARVNSGLRFTSATIAGGSTVDTAVCQVYCEYTADDPNMQIHCETADSGNFSTNADVTSRSRTTAYTQWTANNIGQYAFKTTPDFTAAVQEVIDGGGWASGNAIVVLMAGKSDVDNKVIRITAYDSSSSNCAKLDIDYTAGGGATTRRYSLTTLGVG